jgi:hypothetical protein
MNSDMLRELTNLILSSMILLIPGFIVNLLFAIAVHRDAKSQQQKGLNLNLVGPVVWAFATLLGGVIVAGIYWVMHHSRLKQVEEGEARREREWV